MAITRLRLIGASVGWVGIGGAAESRALSNRAPRGVRYSLAITAGAVGCILAPLRAAELPLNRTRSMGEFPDKAVRVFAKRGVLRLRNPIRERIGLPRSG